MAQMVERSRDVVRDGLPHTEVSMDFHVAVAEASGNELLSATVQAYRDLLIQTLRDMRDPSSAAETQKWHEDILDAIRQHDAAAARDLMQEHLLDFERRIRAFLQSRESDVKAKGATPPPALART
jgi:DNA-binding FadR family transcriptional regulator